MKNFFERLLNPNTIDEPSFTQVIVSVLERDHDLTRFICNKFFMEKGIKVNLSDKKIKIKDEECIVHGGKPDIIVEFYKDHINYASIILENKLNACINNPMNCYLNEVMERKGNGEYSLLVLISKRSAINDEQIQDFLLNDNFLYFNWHEIFIWIKTDYIKTTRERWLAKEFYGYLKLMGVDMSGKFNFGEIGIGEYLPKLIDNFDKVLDETQVVDSIRKFSCQAKNALKDWKNGAAYCKWVYINPNTDYYLAAGFAFTKSNVWEELKVDKFVKETCPVVIFVGLGVEGSPNPELSKWATSLINSKNVKVSSSFVVNDENSEFYLLAKKPLTDFLLCDDHLDACRSYLIERLSEIKKILN